MSKISKKRSFDTLHKNTSSLWNKRYKIAFGIAVTMVSIIAIGMFAKARLSEATETVEESVSRVIDKAVEKLANLVGETKKGNDGKEEIIKNKDPRIDKIFKGLGDSVSLGTTHATDILLDKLSKFAEENKDPDSDGPPTKFRLIVDRLMPIITNMSHKAALSVGIGLKESLPSFLGGIGMLKNKQDITSDLKDIKLTPDQLVKIKAAQFPEKQTDAIELFIKSVQLCETKSGVISFGLTDACIVRRSALKLMLDEKIKFTLDKNGKTISILYKDADNKDMKLITSIGDNITDQNLKELQELIEIRSSRSSFGKKLYKKRTSKRKSKKRSIKKNKKY